jgi:hypothetical protein
VYPQCGHFPMIEAKAPSTRELGLFLAPRAAMPAPAPPKPAPPPEAAPSTEPTRDAAPADRKGSEEK